MASYTYKIGTLAGEVVTGRVEAASRIEAAGQVKKPGWFVLALTEEEKRRFFKKNVKLSSFERIGFTDHLAAMIRAGTPIKDALEAYEEEGSRGDSFVSSLVRGIEQGKKLSEALSRFPNIFSPLYISLVQAGELTGNLDETLEYLANELRREHEFKERIKSALFYPVLVVAVAILVVLLLVLLVIPRITALTKSFGGDLPLITRIVSSVAAFMTTFGPLLVLLFVASIFGLVFLLRNAKTKEKLDPHLLKLPLIGQIWKKYILARFLRIVGSSVKYGIPLSTSFKTVAGVTGNSSYQKSCKRIDEKVVRGVGLSDALAQEGAELFPPIVVRTIRGAEKTGGLDAALLRLSTSYELEVDRDLKRITDLIEPVLVIILGVIVGAIAISVIAPIYQLTSRIK